MQVHSLALPLTLDVPLRGHRTYLHSTSIFDFLVAKTGVNRNIGLSFRRKIEHGAVAVALKACGDAEACPARFSGQAGDNRFDLVIVEMSPLRRLEWREPYDEAAVVADSGIDGLVISSEAGNGATTIERIVALNKRLIAETVAPHKLLIFSKIFLSTLPAGSTPIRVELKSRLGLRLFRSLISANGHEIGEIVFYAN